MLARTDMGHKRQQIRWQWVPAAIVILALTEILALMTAAATVAMVVTVVTLLMLLTALASLKVNIAA